MLYLIKKTGSYSYNNDNNDDKRLNNKNNNNNKQILDNMGTMSLVVCIKIRKL